MHSCTAFCVARATGTDPFSANGPLSITSLLDFLTMESPAPRKIGLSMQISENPHTFGSLFA
jgi:hypothetical protein